MKFLIFILGLILGTQMTLAQNLLPDAVSITTDPAAPKPGETFVVRASSLSTDLDKADISWSINKKFVSSAFGQKEIKTIMPFGGQTTLIEANIKTVTGETFYAKKTISPKRVVLIVEAADSYVPYWYSGKAEVARGGYARVYAYTEIYSGNKKLKPSELVYNWSVRDEPIIEQSGPGKDSLLYRVLDEYGDDVPVSVTISPIDSEDTVTEQTSINTKDGEVLLFLGDASGREISNTSIHGGQKILDKMFSVIAEPFFFSTDYTRNKNLSYIWKTNNITQQDNSNSVRFFKLGDTASGTVTIESTIKHNTRIFQEATRRISLSF